MTMPVMYSGLHGGAWSLDDAMYVRVVFRYWGGAAGRSGYVGFRCSQKT